MHEGRIHALAPGVLLGDRYRLERRIATGGMATVWLGRDEELERPVAVKVLSDLLSEDPSYVARFRREARLAAGLSHPNLVKMYDFSGESERPYLVMEYVEGGTLADRIAAGRAEEIEPRWLAEGLLGALTCIHAAGVVHRDVKPSNVLLDGHHRARLTDFGIAQPEDATQLTSTGEVIGTLRYMAPEVREGHPATERSDLYSCGVLLDECIVGDAAPEVAALVARLTAPDPAERPASAEEALMLLETAPVATEVTVPLGAPAPGAPASREIEINGWRILAVLAALALGAIIVAALALGGGSDSGSGSGTEAKQSEPATTTLSTTTNLTTTETQVAPAAPTTPAQEAKPPKPPKAKPPKPPKGKK